ncbi:MAG: Zn-dependent exopeptidase M28 [Treponema sp.]|jgi:hypothetical protein|nr:Zn-dependent exopeptidase M28 [Treponema sp.]
MTKAVHKRCLSVRGRPYNKRPWDRFFDFIDPGADRYGLLSALAEELALNSVVLPIGENRHFFILPPGQGMGSGGFPFRGKSPVILAAHYDRVEGSSGANDNSAAVFMLLETAARLEKQGTSYWIIILTDKEELTGDEGPEDQGSFSLAGYLRRGGLTDARIFIFDACGAGDTIIVSGTTDHLLKNENGRGVIKTRQIIQALRNTALDTARYLTLQKVLVAPTPFSDDAGFLRAGLPAQTITVLPQNEAASYAALLRLRPGFADILLAGTGQNTADRLLIPETWRTLNGPSDSYLRLTPEHYDQVIRFASALCVM